MIWIVNIKKWRVGAGLALALCQPASADGLLAVVNPAAHAAPATGGALVFSGRYFEANDYVSMRHFSDDWRGPYTPRDGKNLAVSFARADVAALYESWSAGYFYRQDILLQSSKDLTDIVHANKTGTPIQLGRVYDLSLTINGFQARGARLDKVFAWKMQNDAGANLGIGMSLMKGARALMVDARGSALSTASGYTFDAIGTDADSQRTYPFMPPGEISSIGYAFDLGIRLQWQDGKRLDMAVNDLLGEIRWKNVPYTTMAANSATATYDAQGYIAFNPSVYGQNSRKDITQRLDPKGGIQFHAPLVHGLSANINLEWINDNRFPQLGLGYATAHGLNLKADYDSRFETIGLGVTGNNAFLAVRAHSMNLSQSRGYGIETGLTAQF